MGERSGKAVWAGWIVTILASALFGMSAVMKFLGGAEVTAGMEHLGLPASMVLPLGILEATCLAIYLVPRTAVLGAILLTGYIGGAICTHWRVGDPFLTVVVLGLSIWLGIFLREPRLRALIPVRSR